VKRFRLWRLQRAYRQVAKREVALGFTTEAEQLRLEFAGQTVQMIVQQLPRGERRAVLRDLIRTRPAGNQGTHADVSS
jgi:hypothetical protein